MQVFGGFVLMGVIYGIGGVPLTARVGSSLPSLGQNVELDASAAAMIGGTSLAGGVGTIPGAVAGALLLATIDHGAGLANVSSFAQDVVKGMVLLALAMDACDAQTRPGPVWAAALVSARHGYGVTRAAAEQQGVTRL